MVDQETLLEETDAIASDVIAPAAAIVDAEGVFPRVAVDALAEAGLLGLISGREVGGRGAGLGAAALVVERVAEACGSAAMVLCMHYAATAVIEVHGPQEIRERVATGAHLSTLAFSEVGSRAQFWAPLGSASQNGDGVLLSARKSWVTAAREADSYVWSSRPVAAEGLSTLWLVSSDGTGLTVGAPFNGLGLRGNDSSPVDAESVTVPNSAILGADGDGFAVMMGTVLPIFLLMNAGASIGIAEAAARAAAAHAASVRYEHLDQALAEQAVPRARLGRMRVITDAARSLWMDALSAVTEGREDAALRPLAAKAGASEAAITVSDLAMRVCGGAAFRKEVAVERHFRDARAAAVMAPTTDMLHDLIGRAVTGLPLFG